MLSNQQTNKQTGTYTLPSHHQTNFSVSPVLAVYTSWSILGVPVYNYKHTSLVQFLVYTTTSADWCSLWGSWCLLCHHRHKNECLLDNKTVYYLWKKCNDVWWSCQVWVVRGADHKLWSTLCKLQAWKKALGRVKRQYQDVDLGIGNQLTLSVTTVFSRHSDRSIENEMKVHCVSKTDCLVSRVSAVLPDPCLACNGPAESTWQM